MITPKTKVMCPIAAQSSVRSDLQIVVNFLKRCKICMQVPLATSVVQPGRCNIFHDVCMRFHYVGERRSMTCPLIDSMARHKLAEKSFNLRGNQLRKLDIDCPWTLIKVNDTIKAERLKHKN